MFAVSGTEAVRTLEWIQLLKHTSVTLGLGKNLPSEGHTQA